MSNISKKKRSRILSMTVSLLIITTAYFILRYIPGLSESINIEPPLPLAPIVDEGQFALHVLDVGQGDCIVVATAEGCAIIDSGDRSDSTTQYIVNYLRALDIDTVEYFFLTHFDADHIGGAVAVFDNFTVKKAVIPNYVDDTSLFADVINAIKAENCNIHIAKAEDYFSIGDLFLHIIAPVDNYTVANNNSIVIKATYFNTSVMCMGDAENDAIEDILAAYSPDELECDILKLGHHGSSNATTDELLLTLEPEYGIISCGEGNEYGHPMPSVLHLLDEFGIRYYRTDKDGTVVFISDGEDITIEFVQ